LYAKREIERLRQTNRQRDRERLGGGVQEVERERGREGERERGTYVGSFLPRVAELLTMQPKCT
jgi:hypothetical protein